VSISSFYLPKGTFYHCTPSGAACQEKFFIPPPLPALPPCALPQFFAENGAETALFPQKLTVNTRKTAQSPFLMVFRKRR